MIPPGHDIDVEVVLDAQAAVAEGPMWDHREGVLWWVDIPRHELHRLDPVASSDDVFTFDQAVTAVAPRESNGLIAAVRDGFAVIHPERGELRIVAEVEGTDPSTRMNDGRCDPCGSFWAGSMTLDASRAPDAGSLYRLEPDLTVRRVLSGVRISNGMDWSPSGNRMYFIDTLAFSIDVLRFDASTGTATDRRILVAFEERHDPLLAPDGMCVDAEGYLWVALWGGSSIQRYSPRGDLALELRLPATQITSCVFGGADLCDLYITTASSGLSPEEARMQPQAGGIFRCRPGVQGRPTPTFPG